MGIDIRRRDYEPSAQELATYLEGEAQAMWCDFTSYIETAFHAKPKLSYSVCAGKPGWNMKYKKGAKALCTLYPDKGYFTALIVMGQREISYFDIVRVDYDEYIVGLYDASRLYNGTKWLMIEVTNSRIYNSLKMLIDLKAQKAG